MRDAISVCMARLGVQEWGSVDCQPVIVVVIAVVIVVVVFVVVVVICYLLWLFLYPSSFDIIVVFVLSV